MSASAPPDSLLRRSPLVLASALGFLLFVAVAAAGEVAGSILSFALRVSSSGALSKVGWLYVGSFHGVGLSVRVGAFPYLLCEGVCRAPTSGLPEYRLHITLLLGTALLVYLLYRAGRVAGKRSGGSFRKRLVVGAAIAPAYAVPMFVVASFVRVPLPGAAIVEIRPVLWQSFVYPLAIAAVAGAAGGATTGLREVVTAGGRRLVGAIAGGWWMIVSALVLGLIGLFVLAALRPDGAGAYWREVSGHGTRVEAFVLGNQALLAPDQSVLILAASLGSCDRATLPGSSIDLLCFGRQPVARIAGELRLFGAEPTSSDAMPASHYLFVLVPAAATLLGGRRARRISGDAFAGVGAGAVFAGLVFLACVASTVSVRGVFAFTTHTDVSQTVSVGPDLVRTTLLAIVWGVLGGAIGAALPERRQRPEAPSPTSV